MSLTFVLQEYLPIVLKVHYVFGFTQIRRPAICGYTLFESYSPKITVHFMNFYPNILAHFYQTLI